MIVAILLSILFGSYRSLSSEARKAEAVFYNGIDGDGFGINNDLNLRLDASYNFITIAKKYLDANDPAIRSVLEARTALSDANVPSQKYDANIMLTEACTDLGEKLLTKELSERDEIYRKGFLTEMDSRNDIISHDGYNKVAGDFNALLDAFPANILSRIVGIKPLALFR